MKLFVAAIFVALTVSSCRSSRIPTIVYSDLPTLQDVVSEIQLQYGQAIKVLDSMGIKNVKITGAEVTLKIAKEFSTSGELKVLILKGSNEYTQSRSTSVTYKLTEKKNETGSGKAEFVDTKLKDVIIGAAREFNSMKNPLDGLVQEGFDIDVIFSIEHKKGVGFSFEVWKVGADASVDWTRTAEHEIKLTFSYDVKK